MVMPLVQLWVTLQPDASAAHEMLGWTYLVQGEKELARDNMRRALARIGLSWTAPTTRSHELGDGAPRRVPLSAAEPR